MTPHTDPKFTSIEHVREYLAGDRITCLICGKAMKRIGHWHLRIHGLDADGYRERFGIPWSYSLTSAPSRQKSSDSIGPKQLAALMHDGPRGCKPGQKGRPGCQAVTHQWSSNAELGRNASARRRVNTPCSGGCGTILHTTALTAVRPIHCDACASIDALKQRKYQMRKILRKLESLILSSQRAA